MKVTFLSAHVAFSNVEKSFRFSSVLWGFVVESALAVTFPLSPLVEAPSLSRNSSS